jgi:calcium channel MID1
VLAQIPCEIDSASQYSLARTCDDCATAYKAWLCSVMAPRCMDYTATQAYLQPRAIVQPFPNGSSLPAEATDGAAGVLYLNSSRNPNIDTTVKPGPYKELLPCEDLCYALLQSCPAAMAFACPLPGQLGFAQSYGRRPNESQVGQVTCNYPGAVYGVLSGAIRPRPGAATWIGLSAMVFALGSAM